MKRLTYSGQQLNMATKPKSSPAEKAATNKAKAAGNKSGKQFVKQPAKIAKKTANYR